MIELKKRQFLDFEKPIKELYDQIEQLKLRIEDLKSISELTEDEIENF